MAHPNGALVYAPQVRFQIQRSYIKTVRWSYLAGILFAGSGPEWTLIYPPLPGYVAHVKLFDAFWDWGSWRWGLNQVVEHCYEQYLPDPTELPANLLIVAGRDEARGEFLLELVTFSPSQIGYYDLPPRSTPYWTPDPIATP